MKYCHIGLRNVAVPRASLRAPLRVQFARVDNCQDICISVLSFTTSMEALWAAESHRALYIFDSMLHA
jgi:hypothetical protein